MLQTNYKISEPQITCDICSEAVINPLCPFCLTAEINAWLVLYPNLRKELMPRICEYLKKIEDKVEDCANCIKCGNKWASLCSYCFTEHILKELKKIGANKIIIKEFLEFFNFDHTGYYKEAEKLGVF